MNALHDLMAHFAVGKRSGETTKVRRMGFHGKKMEKKGKFYYID